MEKKITPAYKTMFDEAEKQLERQIKSFANLRDYAKTIISISSVIVSFFAIFKSENIYSSDFYKILFIITILVYGILMFLSIIAVKPHPIDTAINPNIDDYVKAYSGRTEFEIASIQIQLYLRAINSNEKALIEKNELSNIISIILASMVFLILMASLFSIK